MLSVTILKALLHTLQIFFKFLWIGIGIVLMLPAVPWVVWTLLNNLRGVHSAEDSE